MAKLNAPLLSLGASGSIGKALVFFGWKGLNVVRQYVVPANPKTDAQTTHRGYFADVVDAIHAAEAHVDIPLSIVDKSAYALLGSCEPSPRTWFNQIIADWLVAKVNEEHPQMHVLRGFTDPFTGQITINTVNYQYAEEKGFFYCGTSKTSLPKRVAADGGPTGHIGVFTGLTKGVKYYFQFRPTKAANDKYVQRSGIYYHVCT